MARSSGLFSCENADASETRRGSAVLFCKYLTQTKYTSIMLTGNQAFAQTHAVNPLNLRVLDTKIAATFGSDEALFLSQLQYWISKGYGVLHKGKRWIYNTYEQWVKQMPWLTRDRFKRMIKRLLNSEVLMIEKLKAHEWKQTNFYTINEEALKAKITMPTASGESNLSSGGLSTDDLYTENTTEKTERDPKNVLEKNSPEKNNSVKAEQGQTGELPEVNCSPNAVDDLPNAGDDKSSEPVEKKLHLAPFHKELLRILQFCDEINNPWAYAQKCVDNLRAGSASSMEVYEKWAETGEILLEDILCQKDDQASEKGKNPSSVKSNQEGMARRNDQGKEEVNADELKEWQIQPTDTDLIEAGYSVGDIYPEFVQWATPRLKYHPDLSEYAAKSHAIKKLKLEPQLTLEMWRDFKRLLVREVEDKRKKESKGQRYFTPAWMQLPADVPVSEARKASVELNEVKVKEQQAMEANRNCNAALTAGEAEKSEKAMELETSYSGEAVVSEEEEVSELIEDEKVMESETSSFEEEAVPSEEEEEEVSELIEDEKVMESEASSFEEEAVPSVPSEEEEEEVLEPIENVKNAIALLEKHPLNPTVEGIVSKIISGAKEQASESELEEINKLIDSSGLDIW